MNINDILLKELFITGNSIGNKTELFQLVAENLQKNNLIDNSSEFITSLTKREEESSTALENGIAIPHGKHNTVKKACVSFVRIDKPIKWDDENTMTDTFFVLAIPQKEQGSTHIDILANIATLLLNEDFSEKLKTINSVEQLWALVDQYMAQEKVNTYNENNPTIVAVTACATGIAHTYMAAEALQKSAAKLGINIYVEKQGANGIEDRLPKEIIKKAHSVLLATDVALQETDRFNGKPYIQVKVAETLKNSEDLLNKLLANKGTTFTSEQTDDTPAANKHLWMQAIMTGISYMIPVLVAAGVIMGIAKVGALGFNLASEIGNKKYATDPNAIISLLHQMDIFGGLIFRFMYPIFSMFVAYTIANRAGILAGFLGGVFASGIHFSLWGVSGIPSGFIGAALLGLFAGYSARWLNINVQLPKSLQAIKPMFIIPAVTVLSIFLLNLYIVEPFVGAFNLSLQNFIISMESSGELTLSSIIAAMTAFDLGGPVNKAAGAIAIGLASDRVFPLTPRVLSIIIPPIGIGLATILDKYIVRRRVFNEELQIAGKTSLVLGFLAISEGALPFMLANPLITIPINVIGAILGSCTAVILGAVQWYPLPAIWGWTLVENFGAYFIGLLVGTLFIAIANILVRYHIITKQEKK